MANEVYSARLASSGPRLGDPPVQVGGSLAGREWGKNGAGADQNVPGTTAGALLGLESVVVDMKPASSGYRYDIYASANVFGIGGEGDGYTMSVYGSTDAGSTFPILLASTDGEYIAEGTCLVESYLTAGDATNTINRVQLQMQRRISASANLQYAPPDACVVVTEISPTS